MKKILLFTVTALTFIACDGTTQDEIVIDESLAVIENELVQSEEVVVDERTISYPIGNYETGILLKPFGLYVTSENSPVQPERFKGYHLGVDVEAPKNVEDVWVYAVADGEVLTVKTVNGYGGVIQIQYLLNDEVYTALYGHLDIGSALVSSGDKVSKGDKLAILGEGYSVETDGERKHLHFSLKPGVDYDLRGYAQNKSELQDWVDPEELLREIR